jgi:hypothetical protein
MRFRLFILAIVGLVFITSCQKSIYSEREQALFISPIFGQDISIDSIETLEDLVVHFDKIYCDDKSADKWPVLYFDLENKKLVNPSHELNILAIGIEPSPCPNVMLEYDFSRILEVVKDGYNLAVEEQRIEPDSLTQYVSKQYLNFGASPLYSPSPKNNGIWLITNKDDRLSNLNNYLAQLLEGYVIMANQYSYIIYKKSLEELTDEEFAQMKKVLAFHLSFKYSDVPPQIKVGF